MAKLYPPYLDGTVPSFYTSEKTEKGDVVKITIPFAMNKAVGKQDVFGFALKIKTLQTNTLLGTFTTMNSEDYEMAGELSVTFDISSLNLTVGQFYKVQLAFINRNSIVGYYSTVAVAKYTAKPSISIEGLVATKTNNHLYTYTGVYSQAGGDSTEKLYSSRFTVYNSDGDLVVDSGEIIHHTYNDESSEEAHEEFTVVKELEANKSYYIYFEATTNNGLTLISPRYRITKANTVSPDLDITLNAELNYEEGYINLILINNTVSDLNNEQKVTGMFYITRAASNDGYAWQEIGNFTLQAQAPSKNLYKDYTVEQGVTYIYAIQQYNNYGLRSDRIETGPVIADFEDAFLYDGERQLKIKYNPKISSFKRDIIEQKTDTIGSQFPFIFRNGNVSYHEFPVSGLISYLGDENREFTTLEELGLEYVTTQLVSENITAERKFKMDVLQWLTNGEPKLFKSPTEGNFIVRLLNVSLSPNDTVGRMLHTFSATAYEVDEFNYDNLKSYNFVQVESDIAQIRYSSVVIAGRNDQVDTIAKSIRSYYELEADLQISEEVYCRILNAGIDISENVTPLFNLIMSETSETYTGQKRLTIDKMAKIAQLEGKVTYAGGKLNTRTAYEIDIREATPGTVFMLDDEEIVIGASGSYNVYLPSGVKRLVLPVEQPNLDGIPPVGLVTYSYASDLSNVFDLYYSSAVEDHPSEMWFGTPTRVKYNPYTVSEEVVHDIVECINDVKRNIVKVYKIRIEPRTVVPIFRFRTVVPDQFVDANGDGIADSFVQEHELSTYTWDPESTQRVNMDSLNEAYLYRVCEPWTDYKYVYEDITNNLTKENYEIGKYYIIDSDGHFRLTYKDLNENLRYFSRWSYDDYYYHTHYITDAVYRHDYYLHQFGEIEFFTNTYYDAYTKEFFTADDTINEFRFNGGAAVKLQDQHWELEDTDIELNSLTIGMGLSCELSYQVNVMTYSAEIEDYQVPKAYRDIYDRYLIKVDEERAKITLLTNEEISSNSSMLQEYLANINNYLIKVNESYEDLCKYVSISKKEYEEAMKYEN